MCGLIAVANESRPAAPDLYVGLLALQHRGQDGAGIAAVYDGQYACLNGPGEVALAFAGQDMGTMPGRMGIGSVRYGTAGDNSEENIPPIEGVFRNRSFRIAQNGNIVNAQELAGRWWDPQRSDTRVIARLISEHSASDFEIAFLDVASRLRGAFNLVAIFNGEIYALRDPFGFHPLELGVRGQDWFVASESCALDQLNANLVRDVRPGELVVLDGRAVRSLSWHPNPTRRLDIFEYIYFLRPDSVFEGVEAGTARYAMGRALALLHPTDADIVVPVPDSGNAAALGYWEALREELGRPVRYRPQALLRPHTVGRTFIEPVAHVRDSYLRLKFNPRPREFTGKLVVRVDDSIVRGTTLRRVVKLVRGAGAREVHAVISSPPYRFPDFYGIDTYRLHGELIARRLEGNMERIRHELDLDSLAYLSLEAVIASIVSQANGRPIPPKDSFYAGPFTGQYPAGTGDFSALVSTAAEKP